MDNQEDKCSLPIILSDIISQNNDDHKFTDFNLSDTDELVGETSRPKAISPKRNYQLFKPKGEQIDQNCINEQKILKFPSKIIIDRFIAYNP